MTTSYSDIDTYASCPQRFYYRDRLRLQAKKRNPRMYEGTLAHTGLQEYYLAKREGRWPEPYHAIWESVDTRLMFSDEMLTAEVLAQNVAGWLEGYFAKYDDQWEILHVEEEFEVGLDSGHIVTFTPDLVIRDENGDVWVVDHKTTAAVPQDGIPFADLQALLYVSGVRALYPECKGFIFNRIRKKLPTRPKLVKNGSKVAYLKTIDTTYEILKDFLVTEAPHLVDDIDHRRRLAELRDQGDRYLWREYIAVTPATVTNVLNDVIARLMLMDRDEEFPRTMQSGYRGCEGCEFQSLCRADLLDWDVERTIEIEYEPRDPKNPYEEAE